MLPYESAVLEDLAPTGLAEWARRLLRRVRRRRWLFAPA